MKILYALDCDETLEISGGPVTIEQLRTLRANGHIVGICGNWACFAEKVPDWYEIASFMGPTHALDWSGVVFGTGQVAPVGTGLAKAEFLIQLRSHIRADRYVMVGNAGPNQSPDKISAHVAGWEFVKEDEFREGLGGIVREPICPVRGADPSCFQCQSPLNKGVHTCEKLKGCG